MEDRKIMASIKISALAFCLMLFLGSALASEYAYGTKVLPGDNDMGLPTHQFGVPGQTPLQGPLYIAMVDIGSVPGAVDAEDVFYLHIGGIPAPLPLPVTSPGATVHANDIRLTQFGNLPAGSKVTPQDNDIGLQLYLPPLGAGQIHWLDLYGTNAITAFVPGYDLQDPVIINVLPPAPAPATSTALNDIRLSNSEGMPAGTKIRNSDPDSDRHWAPGPLISATPTILTPTQIIRYFDANGNGIYDYPDDVYLKFPALPSPANPTTSVEVNDVRISGPAQMGAV
jgi:hypothetical protein